MTEIEAAAEFFAQDGVSQSALRAGHLQILNKARAVLAPFMDTDALPVDCALRSLATPEDIAKWQPCSGCGERAAPEPDGYCSMECTVFNATTETEEAGR